MAELTDLQQAIIRFYHQNPFIEYLHAQVVPTQGGGVRLELTVEEEHTNLYGIIHGGVLTTHIIATGRVLHDGRRTMTCESEIRDEAGKLYAKGHGTFYVLGLFQEEA